MDQIQNNDEKIDGLIHSYSNHQLTADQEAELYAWLSRSKENAHYFVQTYDLLKSSEVLKINNFDSQTAYSQAMAIIHSQKQGTEKHRKISFSPVLRWAAAVVLAFVLGGVSFYFINDRMDQRNQDQYVVYVPYGSRTRVVLPDKSVVWLNSGSTLRYAQNFGKKSRQVSLVGEGYFEVARDAKKPFTVKMNEASVKVLGTGFNIRAYPDEQQLNVTLVHGSVQLTESSQPNKGLILKPNQIAVVDKASHQMTVKQANASSCCSWTKGEIDFDEVPFGQIVQQLERDFNVQIEVLDPRLNSSYFYGKFKNAQSIQEILEIMTCNNEFHYKIDGDKIKIY